MRQFFAIPAQPASRRNRRFEGVYPWFFTYVYPGMGHGE